MIQLLFEFMPTLHMFCDIINDTVTFTFPTLKNFGNQNLKSKLDWKIMIIHNSNTEMTIFDSQAMVMLHHPTLMFKEINSTSRLATANESNL
jgi:hypothetical protein